MNGPLLPSNLTFSPNGDMLAVVHEKTTWIWDVNEKQKLYDFYGKNGWNVDSVAFSNDRNYLAVASTSNPEAVRVWNIVNNMQVVNLSNRPLAKVIKVRDCK